MELRCDGGVAGRAGARSAVGDEDDGVGQRTRGEVREDRRRVGRGSGGEGGEYGGFVVDAA